MLRPMSKDARAAAAEYYAGSYRSLESDIAALCRNPQGVVLFSPRLVVLMKPVVSYCAYDWWRLEEAPAEADAWYVHLLAGDVTLALHLAHTLPPLRWLCFQRGRRGTAVHRLPWPAMPHLRSC